MEQMTQEARGYALKELARRAGVAEEVFRSWRIEWNEDATTLYVEPGTAKRIRFKNSPPSFPESLAATAGCTVRASWGNVAPETLRSLVPDFVIPFSAETQSEGQPLFAAVGRDCVECPVDLPRSVLLSLCRVEETLSPERDEHCRFAARSSVALREGFLRRPIVDEYGLAFAQALSQLAPGWEVPSRELRVKVSHDVDVTGLPFSAMRAAWRVLRDGDGVAAWDLGRWIVGRRPTYLEMILRLVSMDLVCGLDCAVYWKAARPGPRDSGYDPRDPRIREVIGWLEERDVEMGVHPGYETFRAPELLGEEVRVLREVLGEGNLGGRQHYLRWCPETWLHWEACGLAYDSTLGYADQVGFRAGTSFPYRPWILSLNREANLIEIPLIVMDSTLVAYMGLPRDDAIRVVRECVERCRCVGGIFTLLWHNTSLVAAEYRGLYERILEMLAGGGRFDWRSPATELY